MGKQHRSNKTKIANNKYCCLFFSTAQAFTWHNHQKRYFTSHQGMWWWGSIAIIVVTFIHEQEWFQHVTRNHMKYLVTSARVSFLILFKQSCCCFYALSLLSLLSLIQYTCIDYVHHTHTNIQHTCHTCLLSFSSQGMFTTYMFLSL